MASLLTANVGYRLPFPMTSATVIDIRVFQYKSRYLWPVGAGSLGIRRCFCEIHIFFATFFKTDHSLYSYVIISLFLSKPLTRIRNIKFIIILYQIFRKTKKKKVAIYMRKSEDDFLSKCQMSPQHDHHNRFSVTNSIIYLMTV